MPDQLVYVRVLEPPNTVHMAVLEHPLRRSIVSRYRGAKTRITQSMDRSTEDAAFYSGAATALRELHVHLFGEDIPK